MYLEEEDVIRHIPEELRKQMKEQSTYLQIIDEKIDIAEKYVIYNILNMSEMPPTVQEDIKMVMSLISAVLLIENYTLVSPQVFGNLIEEDGIKGTLIGRINTLLKDLKSKYYEYTLLDGMGNEEDSFIYKNIIKDKVFEND